MWCVEGFEYVLVKDIGKAIASEYALAKVSEVSEKLTSRQEPQSQLRELQMLHQATKRGNRPENDLHTYFNMSA